MSPTINLKKLAEHLGISQTTVSRALNGFPEVSEKTRERVQTAARELNYRPSPSASNLATGKSRVIGHVLPISDHRMINPHFSDFLAGAGTTYSAAGYDLLLRMAETGQEETIYRELKSQRRVDGVVVHGPLVDDPRIELLQSLELPFVVHGRTGCNTDRYSWVDVNNHAAFQRATQYLIDRGHRRISLINGLESMNFAHRRRLGYESAMEQNQLPLDSTAMYAADMTEPYGYRATLNQLKSEKSPTAILYASILSAMGGLRALGDLGLRPGRDIAIITFDDDLSFLKEAGDVNGEVYFTVMKSSIQAAGKRVAEMLLDQIANPLKPPQQELWEAEFIEGQTTFA